MADDDVRNDAGGHEPPSEPLPVSRAAPASERAKPSPGSAEGDYVEIKRLEVMDRISPDGRPTGIRTFRIERAVFAAAAVLIGVCVLAIIVAVGGVVAVAMALAYLVLLAIAASPVWGAALLRRREEVRAQTEAIQALRRHRRRWWRRRRHA
jgi:hypothetical protein